MHTCFALKFIKKMCAESVNIYIPLIPNKYSKEQLRLCLQTKKLAERLSGNLVHFCNIFKIYLKTIPHNQLRNHKNPYNFKHEKTYLQPLLTKIHSHFFLFFKNRLKMKGVYYVRTPSRQGVETGESPPNLGVCLLSPQGATSDTKRVFENCLIVFNHCLPLLVCETQR